MLTTLCSQNALYELVSVPVLRHAELHKAVVAYISKNFSLVGQSAAMKDLASGRLHSAALVRRECNVH